MTCVAGRVPKTRRYLIKLGPPEHRRWLRSDDNKQDVRVCCHACDAISYFHLAIAQLHVMTLAERGFENPVIEALWSQTRHDYTTSAKRARGRKGKTGRGRRGAKKS